MIAMETKEVFVLFLIEREENVLFCGCGISSLLVVRLSACK
jgi:hypothetical protein